MKRPRIAATSVRHVMVESKAGLVHSHAMDVTSATRRKTNAIGVTTPCIGFLSFA
jgi:hypothetical protein